MKMKGLMTTEMMEGLSWKTLLSLVLMERVWLMMVVVGNQQSKDLQDICKLRTLHDMFD
jgi:hypothetical protein